MARHMYVYIYERSNARTRVGLAGVVHEVASLRPMRRGDLPQSLVYLWIRTVKEVEEILDD